MSTLWIGLWPVGWLSRLNACQQPLGEASSACCKERFLYTWQQYVIPGFYYTFILQAQQPLGGLIVSLGEKDHPACLGMLTAGSREGSPGHHPPGGSCQQITASGRRLGKGKAVFSRQALTFQQLYRAAAPFFLLCMPNRGPSSPVALYQEPSFLHGSGREGQGWRCCCVSTCVVLALVLLVWALTQEHPA